MKKTLVLIVALAMMLSIAVVGCSDAPGGDTTTTTTAAPTSDSNETDALG
jgi:ABC-type glycerol-3-phosphate transport system substrate-binding protein